MAKAKASLPAVAAAFVVSNLPGFALTVIAACKITKPQFRWNRELHEMLLRESFPLFVYIILIILYERMDVLQLKAIQGDAAVGLYASAFRLVSPLSFIPMAVASSLYPLMSRFSMSSELNLDKAFAIGIKILVTIGIPLGLGAALVGAEVYRILYTSVFWPAATTFKILVWAQVILFFNFFLATFNVSIDSQRHNIWAALTMCLGAFALNTMLIPRWGTNGAATAKLLANLMGLTVFFYFAYRRTVIALAPIIVKFLGVALVFISWLVLGRELDLIIVLILSAIVYPLLLLIFGVFDENEKRVLIGLIRRSA
jgi:O-antigen/teichoic acid export membrane protein